MSGRESVHGAVPVSAKPTVVAVPVHRVRDPHAKSLIELGRFDEAILAARKAVRQNPSYSAAYRCLACALAHLERDTEARQEAARVLEHDPAFTISTYIARGLPGAKAKLLIEGLRKAGLPE